MRIELKLLPTRPPTGMVTAGGRERPFVGWLGLLRVMSELVDELDRDVAGRLDGELDSGGDTELGEDVRQVRIHGPP